MDFLLILLIAAVFAFFGGVQFEKCLNEAKLKRVHQDKLGSLQNYYQDKFSVPEENYDKIIS